MPENGHSGWGPERRVVSEFNGGFDDVLPPFPAADDVSKWNILMPSPDCTPASIFLEADLHKTGASAVESDPAQWEFEDCHVRHEWDFGYATSACSARLSYLRIART